MASLGWAEACPKGSTRLRASPRLSVETSQPRVSAQPRCGLLRALTQPGSPSGDHDAVAAATTGQHRFYCGIDLHTKTLSLCVLDSAGAIAYFSAE